MRKTVIYLSGLLLFALASCEEKMPESLSPQTTSIEGNMGEYFEVVQEEYPVELMRLSIMTTMFRIYGESS